MASKEVKVRSERIQVARSNQPYAQPCDLYFSSPDVSSAMPLSYLAQLQSYR